MPKKSKNLAKIISTLVVVSVILVLVLMFKLVFKKEPLTEKDKFIEANTLVTCEILKDPSLSVDLKRSKEISNKIFGEYDFPVEDNEAMLTLLDKYEQDETVLAAVQEKLLSECELPTE